MNWFGWLELASLQEHKIELKKEEERSAMEKKKEMEVVEGFSIQRKLKESKIKQRSDTDTLPNRQQDLPKNVPNSATGETTT